MTTEIWTAERIKAAVHAKGKTLRGLARDHDLHDLAPSTALIRRHKTAEIAIAEFLGMPLWILWPDRWTTQGTRIDHRFLPPIVTRDPMGDARQKAKAA